jgi:hypothetical protein
MKHGGKRKGAGRKSQWIRGKTVVVRVPEVLSEEVLRLAHLLDEGKTVEDVTRSRYLDLSGVPVRYVEGRPVVYIEDLLKKGFKVRPLKLIDELRRKIDLLR